MSTPIFSASARHDSAISPAPRWSSRCACCWCSAAAPHTGQRSSGSCSSRPPACATSGESLEVGLVLLPQQPEARLQLAPVVAPERVRRSSPSTARRCCSTGAAACCARSSSAAAAPPASPTARRVARPPRRCRSPRAGASSARIDCASSSRTSVRPARRPRALSGLSSATTPASSAPVRRDRKTRRSTRRTRVLATEHRRAFADDGLLVDEEQSRDITEGQRPRLAGGGSCERRPRGRTTRGGTPAGCPCASRSCRGRSWSRAPIAEPRARRSPRRRGAESACARSRRGGLRSEPARCRSRRLRDLLGRGAAAQQEAQALRDVRLASVRRAGDDVEPVCEGEHGVLDARDRSRAARAGRSRCSQELLPQHRALRELGAPLADPRPHEVRQCLVADVGESLGHPRWRGRAALRRTGRRRRRGTRRRCRWRRRRRRRVRSGARRGRGSGRAAGLPRGRRAAAAARRHGTASAGGALEGRRARRRSGRRGSRGRSGAAGRAPPGGRP